MCIQAPQNFLTRPHKMSRRPWQHYTIYVEKIEGNAQKLSFVMFIHGYIDYFSCIVFACNIEE